MQETITGKEAAALHEFKVLWSGKYYQHWENELHSHSYCQIISVLKGSGMIQIGEERFDFSERSTFLIHPHVPHAVLRNSPEDQPQMMDIKFTVADGPIASDVAALPAKLEEGVFSRFQYYFDRILRESEEDLPYSYERICMYFGLALTAILRSGQEKELEGLPTGPEELSVDQMGGVDMRRVTQYINQNYASPISLEELAKVAIVSKSTLINAFKLAYDTTPIKYINRVRLNKAKALLLNTDSSVSEISEMVGFQSLHYFSRYFKNHEDLSPVEYRQRYSKNVYFTYRVPVQTAADDLSNT